MKPEGLTPRDGTVIIDILRRKAQALNALFGGTVWTPRKVDKVCWALREKGM
jgi:hypothetical protein